MFFDHTDDIPIANSACPSGSLHAAGLTRPHQFEVLHLAFYVEAHLLRKAEINHILNTEDSDGTFSNIGGNENLVLESSFLVQFLGNFISEYS